MIALNSNDYKEFVMFLSAGVFMAASLLFFVAAIPVAIAVLIYLIYQKNKKPDHSELYAIADKLTQFTETDYCNAVYEHLPYDVYLEETIRGIWQREGIEVPPFPQVLTPIEIARYKDKASAYLSNNTTEFVKATADALRPLVANKTKGLFKGFRTLTHDDVEYIAFNFEHPRFFKDLYQHLLHNRKNAKEPFDYIRGTPLAYAYERPTAVDLKNRNEHTLCLASTGAGKTQLIQYLISKDLEEDCTIIVIDNQRQMIPKLARLGVDMQYLSPHFPLALNLFDLPTTHHTAPLLQYVLSGLMNAPLTAKQELVFQFGVSLMLAHKGNLYDFQDLLAGKQFDLSHVDATTRRFFTEEYYKKGREGYESTRSEISWRIWSLLKNPILRDMFAAKDNKCALEMDRKLILIDCDIDLLQDYSGLFGRFFLAQLLLIAQQRFVSPGRPVYVYVDECYHYLDQSVLSMLETARKANIGLFLAHQFRAQITEPKVSAALMSLTSTKFAAQLSPEDTRAMASAMHTTPDFITAQKKLNFALWQRGETTVSIEVPAGVIEAMPQHPIPDMTARYGRTETPPAPEITEPLMVPEE